MWRRQRGYCQLRDPHPARETRAATIRIAALLSLWKPASRRLGVREGLLGGRWL